MQSAPLNHRSFAHRFTLRLEGCSQGYAPHHRGIPWPPWPARRGGPQINGAAIRIQIKHLKTNDVRISNLRYCPVFESSAGAAKDLSPVLVLIYGDAIRIEIKHLKTNDVKISNLRYSPVFESENGSSQSESRVPRPARRGGRLIYGAAIRIEIKPLKTKDVKISNLRYSPYFGLLTTTFAPLSRP